MRKIWSLLLFLFLLGAMGATEVRAMTWRVVMPEEENFGAQYELIYIDTDYHSEFERAGWNVHTKIDANAIGARTEVGVDLKYPRGIGVTPFVRFTMAHGQVEGDFHEIGGPSWESSTERDLLSIEPGLLFRKEFRLKGLEVSPMAGISYVYHRLDFDARENWRGGSKSYERWNLLLGTEIQGEWRGRGIGMRYLYRKGFHEDIERESTGSRWEPETRYSHEFQIEGQVIPEKKIFFIGTWKKEKVEGDFDTGHEEWESTIWGIGVKVEF